MAGLDNNRLTAAGIGREVRRHRRIAGLTQKELAELAGIGKTVVFDIEKGKPGVRLNTLTSVLDVLNIRLRLDSPLPQEVEHA